MATLTLRIDDGTRDELETLARGRGTNTSELLRGAIDHLLGRDIDEIRGEAPGSLTMVQRRSLALLHEILANQLNDPDEVEYHQQQIAVLNGGYTGNYPDEFMAVETELTRRECSMVWDILDMFRVVRASIAEVEPGELAKIHDHADVALTFRGFDMNDPLESRLLGYVHHLIKAGRWEELAVYVDDEHDRGNSHMRTLPSYQRMLAVYTPIFHAKLTGQRGRGRHGLLFDLGELAEVVKAWFHPH